MDRRLITTFVVFITVCKTLAFQKNLDHPCGGVRTRGPAGLVPRPLNGLTRLMNVLEDSTQEAQRLFNKVKRTTLDERSLVDQLRGASEIELPESMSRISLTVKRHGLMRLTHMAEDNRRVKRSLVDLYGRSVYFSARIEQMHRAYSNHGFTNLRNYAFDQTCALKQVLELRGWFNDVDQTIIEGAKRSLSDTPSDAPSTLQMLVTLAFYKQEFLPAALKVARQANDHFSQHSVA